MKKSQKMRGLIAVIAVALFIDFTVLFGSNLSWEPKLVITGISVLGQIVAIWGWLHRKPRPHKSQKGKEKIIFDLSAKLYAILVFAASIFYTVGIWVANPSESSGIKEWILGIGLIIEVIVFVFFSLKNVKVFFGDLLGNEPGEGGRPSVFRGVVICGMLYLLALRVKCQMS